MPTVLTTSGSCSRKVVTSWEQRRHSAGPTETAMPVGRRRAEGSCATEAIRLRRSWRSGGPTSGATPTVLTSLALCSTSDRRSRERCRRSGARSGTGSCRCSGGHQAAAGTGPRSATPRAGAATSSPTATFTCLGCVAGRPRRCGRSRQERHRLGVRDAARALGSDQQAWISYETVTPDYELVLLQSPIAPVGSVDLAELVKRGPAAHRQAGLRSDT